MKIPNVNYEHVTKIYLWKFGDVPWNEYIEERDRVCARVVLNGLIIKEMPMIEEMAYIIKIYGAVENNLLEHILGNVYDVAAVKVGYTKELLHESLRSDIYECLDQNQSQENLEIGDSGFE